MYIYIICIYIYILCVCVCLCVFVCVYIGLMHAEHVHQVKEQASECEREFPGSVLMYYEKMPFAPRCALFSVCDALVMASVRHGLSLVCVCVCVCVCVFLRE
jgi:hypothetical protein